MFGSRRRASCMRGNPESGSNIYHASTLEEEVHGTGLTRVFGDSFVDSW